MWHPPESLRDIARSVIFLMLPSIAILFLVLEFTARAFFPVSDVPDVIFDADLGNHFSPNQGGVYISGLHSEIQAKYRINNEGWNSPYDYVRNRATGGSRIAVIGDSYVEALQVDYDQSFPYILENELREKHPDCLIGAYSFGHSGASLAQYIKVAQYAAKRHSPDVIIVNVVHNDFLESLAGMGRVDNWSVRPVGTTFEFVPPHVMPTLGVKRVLRQSAIVRYLLINARILERFYGVKRLLEDAENLEANIDSDIFDLRRKNDLMERMVGFLLNELTVDADGIPIVVVMDGNRQAIYKGEDPFNTRSFGLNKLVGRQAEKHGISFIDLTQWFAEDWHREGKKFDWDIDNHWNRRGHEITALAIAELLNRREPEFCPEEAISASSQIFP